MRVIVRGFLSAALLVACSVAAARAQGVEYIQAHYRKHEFRIPMRDGTKLFTAVYVPKDDSQAYPILLTRTPYGVGPYGSGSYPAALGPSEKFAREGYIIACQDVRGRNKSEGEFVDVRPYMPQKRGPKDIDESTDAYDTIEWLLKNVPGNNGRAGMWGISYPGFYAAMGAIDAHPALKAVSPQAPVTDWFLGDDFHHNGAQFLAPCFNFLAFFGRPGEPRLDLGTPDGYSFFLDLGPLSNVDAKYFKGKVAFWEEIVKHSAYDDFWKARTMLPYLKNIKPAVMTVGGWFDSEDLYGALHVYDSIEKQNPGVFNILVMGPWPHGGWARRDGDVLGNVRFDAKTSFLYRDQIESPFFEYFLKGKGNPRLPEAYVFETGKNQWRRQETWPPKAATARTLYLGAGGRLSFEPPREDQGKDYDEYVSDPARPVPFTERIDISTPVEYMVDDQRFASRRPDVLVYQTDALESDVTLAGPAAASLRVSTTGTDSDWVVKLIDVYPNDYPDPTPNPAGVRMGGYQQLVRGEPMRGKFRNSFEKPEPFEPDKVTKVEFVLPDVYHSFRRGHRIMIQIQSAWFPLVDRNPQKFVDIYRAVEADFQKATQRVYHTKADPSTIRVSVLK
jgi:putative CocE/NonD family hydrolase